MMMLLHSSVLLCPHLLRKSTDTSDVLLELSDMFSTSTSYPSGHSSVFTAYLKAGDSFAVAGQSLS